MAMYNQVSQYFCKNCSSLLTQTRDIIEDIILNSIAEECPSCGSALQHNIIEKRQASGKVETISATTFQTAYDQLTPARLMFGIHPLDTFFDLTGTGGICIVGRHTNLLIARLCIHAIMSRKYKGYESPVIEFVDAGNSFGVYQCSSFARQYGLDVKRVLESVAIQRPFTPHQVAQLVVNLLPASVRRSGAKVVVVSDLLRLFLDDPGIDGDEARWLIQEVGRALTKKFIHRIVVVSLHTAPSDYDADVLSLFRNRIEIAAEDDRTVKATLHNSKGQEAELLLSERELQLACHSR
jgi:hypothetical protein